MKVDLKEKSNSGTVSIVDLIIADRNEEKAEVDSFKPEAVTITADNFFKEDNPNGIASKAEFHKIIGLCENYELKGLELLFDLMSQGANIDAPPYTKPDGNKNESLWCSRKGKKGTTSFKILPFGQLATFIGLYQFEIVQFNVSLAELYKKAKN